MNEGDDRETEEGEYEYWEYETLSNRQSGGANASYSEGYELAEGSRVEAELRQMGREGWEAYSTAVAPSYSFLPDTYTHEVQIFLRCRVRGD